MYLKNLIIINVSIAKIGMIIDSIAFFNPPLSATNPMTLGQSTPPTVARAIQVPVAIVSLLYFGFWVEIVVG